jgi:hypothetical protein
MHWGVNMFKTSTGFLGVGPFGRNDYPDVLPAVQAGDRLALFQSVQQPIILPDFGDDTYNLVGMAEVGNLLEISRCGADIPKTVPLLIR